MMWLLAPLATEMPGPIASTRSWLRFRRSRPSSPRSDAPVNALCAVGQPRAGLVAAGAARISYGAGLFRAVEGRHVELLNAL